MKSVRVLQLRKELLRKTSLFHDTSFLLNNLKQRPKNFVTKGFQSLGEHTFVGIAHTYIVCKFENNRMKRALNIDF